MGKTKSSATLKVATWNMAYWSHKSMLNQSWEYFLEQIDADIYLFQESRPPAHLIDDPNFFWFEIENRKWGTGIYSKKYPVKHLPVKTQYEGSLVLGEVQIAENKTLTVISLYGLLDKIEGRGYSITTLHRMLSDLTGILNGHIGGRRNVILGGDLNASLQFDPISSPGGKSHHILFERIEDFGLVNCLKLFYDGHVQTLRHHKSTKPWQNDYFFVSNKLSKKLESCEVIDNEMIRKFSDHNPLVITLKL